MFFSAIHLSKLNYVLFLPKAPVDCFFQAAGIVWHLRQASIWLHSRPEREYKRSKQVFPINKNKNSESNAMLFCR